MKPLAAAVFVLLCVAEISADDAACSVSDWSIWSTDACFENCGNGSRTRSRVIVSKSASSQSNHEEECPQPLTETAPCPCDRDCVVEILGDWSQCSSADKTSCGTFSERPYRILQQPSGEGRACDASLFRAACNEKCVVVDTNFLRDSRECRDIPELLDFLYYPVASYNCEQASAWGSCSDELLFPAVRTAEEATKMIITKAACSATCRNRGAPSACVGFCTDRDVLIDAFNFRLQQTNQQPSCSDALAGHPAANPLLTHAICGASSTTKCGAAHNHTQTQTQIRNQQHEIDEMAKEIAELKRGMSEAKADITTNAGGIQAASARIQEAERALAERKPFELRHHWY
jgi:hypothetical protein